MNPITALERKYIPKTRRKKWYKIIKSIIILCILPGSLVVYPFVWLWQRLSTTKITRKDKPDIVLKNIVAGFAHLIHNDPEVEAIAKNRAAICATCPFAEKFGLYSIVVDNKTKQIQGMKCGKCGCNLSAKVRSMEDQCPLGKW